MDITNNEGGGQIHEVQANQAMNNVGVNLLTRVIYLGLQYVSQNL